MDLLLIVTSLFAGLTAGVFFAFSNFIMRGLDRLGPAAAGDAMRSINVTVITPTFMLLLFGTAIPLIAAGVGVWREEPAVALPVLAAVAVYILGCLGVTMFGNVPLNNALDAQTIGWADYASRWLAWNHVRTVACAVTALLLAYAASR